MPFDGVVVVPDVADGCLCPAFPCTCGHDIHIGTARRMAAFDGEHVA
jgi:hypothetical protein